MDNEEKKRKLLEEGKMVCTASHDSWEVGYLFGKHELTGENSVSFLNKKSEEIKCYYGYHGYPWSLRGPYRAKNQTTQETLAFTSIQLLKRYIKENKK